jgi:hypothetical protein
MDLAQVPDYALELFVQWRNERVAEENARFSH